MFHLLAGMIAYIILCTICVTSIVGTGFVWWTYYRVKEKLDNTPLGQLLEESVHNEHALCLYGIICVVITVSSSSDDLTLLRDSLRRGTVNL